MWKIALLYATKHNHTKKVVDNILVDFQFDVYNVSNCDQSVFHHYDLIIIFCPTYGDEELPLEMEDFIHKLTIINKAFVICELGNYYGYDDYQFGALKILKNQLLSLGWTEAMPGLSLDSLPKIEWDCFYKWCRRLNQYVSTQDTVSLSKYTQGYNRCVDGL